MSSYLKIVAAKEDEFDVESLDTIEQVQEALEGKLEEGVAGEKVALSPTLVRRLQQRGLKILKDQEMSPTGILDLSAEGSPEMPEVPAEIESLSYNVVVGHVLKEVKPDILRLKDSVIGKLEKLKDSLKDEKDIANTDAEIAKVSGWESSLAEFESEEAAPGELKKFIQDIGRYDANHELVDKIFSFANTFKKSVASAIVTIAVDASNKINAAKKKGGTQTALFEVMREVLKSLSAHIAKDPDIPDLLKKRLSKTLSTRMRTFLAQSGIPTQDFQDEIWIQYPKSGVPLEPQWVMTEPEQVVWFDKVTEKSVSTSEGQPTSVGFPQIMHIPALLVEIGYTIGETNISEPVHEQMRYLDQPIKDPKNKGEDYYLQLPEYGDASAEKSDEDLQEESKQLGGMSKAALLTLEQFNGKKKELLFLLGETVPPPKRQDIGVALINELVTKPNAATSLLNQWSEVDKMSAEQKDQFAEQLGQTLQPKAALELPIGARVSHRDFGGDFIIVAADKDLAMVVPTMDSRSGLAIEPEKFPKESLVPYTDLATIEVGAQLQHPVHGNGRIEHISSAEGWQAVDVFFDNGIKLMNYRVDHLLRPEAKTVQIFTVERCPISGSLSIIASTGKCSQCQYSHKDLLENTARQTESKKVQQHVTHLAGLEHMAKVSDVQTLARVALNDLSVTSLIPVDPLKATAEDVDSAKKEAEFSMDDFQAGVRVCKAAIPSLQGVILYADEDSSTYKIQWDNGKQAVCWAQELAKVADMHRDLKQDDALVISRAEEMAHLSGKCLDDLTSAEKKALLELAIEQLEGRAPSPTLAHLGNV